MSINISLPVELENRVREQVASGLYGSASEVVREALRFFEQHQQAFQSQEKLRLDVLKGLEDVQSGRVMPADFAAIKAKARAQ